MKENKTTVDEERKKIRKILKNTYPGCKTYIRAQDDSIWTVRVIHEKFANQGVHTSITELVDLLTPHVESCMVVEPICQATWDSRRW